MTFITFMITFNTSNILHTSSVVKWENASLLLMILCLRHMYPKCMDEFVLLSFCRISRCLIDVEEKRKIVPQSKQVFFLKLSNFLSVTVSNFRTQPF